MKSKQPGNLLRGAQANMEYPFTRKSLVQDEYHGIYVNDEYRWLEESQAAEVQQWTVVQNRALTTSLISRTN